jgi:hypothetical protein
LKKVVNHGGNLAYGIEQGVISSGDGTPSASDLWCRPADFIPVTPSTQYAFSYSETRQLDVMEYDIDKTFIVSTTVSTGTGGTKTVSSDTRYIKFRCGGVTELDITTINVQMNQGSTATPIQSHFTAPLSWGVKVRINSGMGMGKKV